MTEKRFTSQRTHDYNYSDILDNGKWVGICHVDCEDDFVDKLNGLAEENQRLKNDCSILVQSNQEYRKENEQLKKENRKFKNEINLLKLKLKEKNEGFDKIHKMYMGQIQENKELKERNNRQAQTIQQLYELIEKQDWESLTAIIYELKQAEEQLQKEWPTYGDVE